MASTIYRPSNGTEGETFMERWCWRCLHDSEDAPCPILTATMVYGADDPEYPVEWQTGPEGPRCTAFTAAPDAEPMRCAATPDLFA